MIICCPEMDKLIINSNWELKPFDLKLINNLLRNHPYQKIMYWVYKYYYSYDDGFEGDILDEIDYFNLLDRYYRYGITFEDDDLYPEKKNHYMKMKILMEAFHLDLEFPLKMVILILEKYYM